MEKMLPNKSGLGRELSGMDLSAAVVLNSNQLIANE
jgi:hypothetical protein